VRSERSTTPKDRKSPTKDKSSLSKEKLVPTTTAQITTVKTTAGHTAALEARNWAYQEYKSHFESTLQSIENSRQQHLVAEQRWTDSWHSSVQKVKNLYVPSAS